MSNANIKSVDTIKLKRGLTILFLFLLTVFGAGYVIRTGNSIFMVGFIALPFVLMLMNRPDIAFVLALWLDATKLPIPGVSYTTLGLVAKVVLIGSVFIAFLMGQKKYRGERMAEDKPLKLFVAIIIMLMVARGSGLRMLGSSTWGGMVYVVLLLGIAFYFSIQGLTVSRRQIRLILWGVAIFGVIGSFMQFSGWKENVEVGSDIAKSRLSWLRPIVNAFFPLIFALRLRRWVATILWVGVIGMMALTGFRSALVGLVVISGIFGLFRARAKMNYIVLCAVVGCILWGSAIVLSPMLPKGIQRSISFVPGTKIDYRTRQDAKGSIDWRVEIWKYCLERAPQYLLIGRGSSFNAHETAEQLSNSDIGHFSPWFAYQTRSYHSGPLTLLIDYGLPGLLVGLWLTVAVMRRLVRWGMMLRQENSIEARFVLISICQYLWAWVAYFLVFGAAPGFARMIAGTASIVVLANSVLNTDETHSEASAEREALGG